MDPINEVHASRPGLVVAAADDATALAFQQHLADRWATSTAERTRHDVDQPGVRLRCYLPKICARTRNSPTKPDPGPAPLSEVCGTWTPAPPQCRRRRHRRRPPRPASGSPVVGRRPQRLASATLRSLCRL
ncbi:DUF6207 family protein [Streptomyces galilaeus]|uniref:DUF6207 family protein n=1 Tax=Streptomyces galilaeus TaxID=33899 RepID=A0ABW9IVJ5_STRGJ